MNRASNAGYTIVELMVVVVIIAVLALIATAGVNGYRQRALRVNSSANLRVLGTAALDYVAENNGRFFPYRRVVKGEGVQWWFGKETKGGSEGKREIDRGLGPLGSYIEQAGGVEICPGLEAYADMRKAKFKGTSFGYGYNVHLGGGWLGNGARLNLVTTKHRASGIAVFATCAQVNTFQPPASPDNPMVEEFYGFDQRQKTIHFRFNRKALVLFANGGVKAVEPEEGTMDKALESADVGRFSPVGSTMWLGID